MRISYCQWCGQMKAKCTHSGVGSLENWDMVSLAPQRSLCRGWWRHWQGKRPVAGAAASDRHTAVWTGAGELFTLGKETMGSWAMATEGHRVSLFQGWSRRWRGRRRLVHQQVVLHQVLTQQYGPRPGSSSPLGMQALGSWAMEGHSKSLCRGWLRRWSPDLSATLTRRILI